MRFLQILNPETSRRNLLFIAALVWTYAGGMLLTKGITMMSIDHEFLLIRMAFSILGGLLFYKILFSKISKKHIARIILLNERSGIFSFFNFKSYLMMIFMILFGVFLRKSGIVPTFYLSILYVTMGIPLSASACRFFCSGIYYQLVDRNINEQIW